MYFCLGKYQLHVNQSPCMLQRYSDGLQELNLFYTRFMSFLCQKQTRWTAQETNFLGYRGLNWRGGWKNRGVRNVANKNRGGGGSWRKRVGGYAGERQRRQNRRGYLTSLMHSYSLGKCKRGVGR